MCRECRSTANTDHAKWWGRWGKLQQFSGGFSGAQETEREDLWKDVTGERILEVRVGLGASLKHYPADSVVTALDISEPMIQIAHERAIEEDVDVELLQMSVEDLSFEDRTFDTIVSNSTLCCTEDIHAAAEELNRVLKPNGRFVMLENVRPDTPWLAALFERLEPVARFLHAGYFHRNTPKILREHGFTIETIQSRDKYGKRKFVVASPAGEKGPQYVGG